MEHPAKMHSKTIIETDQIIPEELNPWPQRCKAGMLTTAPMCHKCFSNHKTSNRKVPAIILGMISLIDKDKAPFKVFFPLQLTTLS